MTIEQIKNVLNAHKSELTNGHTRVIVSDGFCAHEYELSVSSDVSIAEIVETITNSYGCEVLSTKLVWSIFDEK